MVTYSVLPWYPENGEPNLALRKIEEEPAVLCA